jgi:hypothetical protein
MARRPPDRPGEQTIRSRVEARNGSFASVWPNHGDFRSTPVNGHSQDRRACLKGANRRHREIGRRLRRPYSSGRECSRKKRSTSLVAPGPRGSSLGVRRAASGACVSGSVDIPVLQHPAPTRVVDVPDILSRVAPHLGGGFHSERKKKRPAGAGRLNIPLAKCPAV